jgi:hypothetical protein
MDRRRYAWLLGCTPARLLPSDREDPDLPPRPDTRRGALIGLIITLLLVAGGIFLVHVLDRAAKLQDCVMSGRTNCAPIDTKTLSR